MVVITKSVTSCIIRRIDIDELDFAREARMERVESEEIVAFDQEILTEIAVLIPELDIVRVRDSTDAVYIDFFKFCQDFRLSERIDIGSVECRMEELLLPSCIFARHPSLKDAIFERKREDDITRGIDEGLFFGVKESDFTRIIGNPSFFERVLRHKKAFTK